MSRSKKIQNVGDGCLVPFHYLYTLSGGSAAAQLSLLPASFPRVLIEADAWAHFRVTKLAFRLLPPANNDAAGTLIMAAAGFCGGMEDTPPATLATISELIPSCFMPGHQQTPSAWIRVSKKELQGPFPWYKTIQGTVDTTEESPGQMCFLINSNTTSTLYVEFKGVFEFKTSIASGNTPMYLEFLKKVREERVKKRDDEDRGKLLRVIASASNTAKTTP